MISHCYCYSGLFLTCRSSCFCPIFCHFYSRLMEGIRHIEAVLHCRKKQTVSWATVHWSLFLKTLANVCILISYLIDFQINWPDIPVKSAAVGLKASLMPIAGRTDLRLNLFCILNLWTAGTAVGKPKIFSLGLKKHLYFRWALTWVKIYPSWSCVALCPMLPAGERWAGTRGRTVASSCHWAGRPAGSASGLDTAPPALCNAAPTLSWTDLSRRARSWKVWLL